MTLPARTVDGMAHNPNSVDELIVSTNARGLRVANLFQLENGLWQANVTDGQRVWEFGRGATAAIALRAALFTAANEEGVIYGPAGPQKAPSAKAKLPLSPEDLDL